jgi:hypothetical protein
MLAVSARVFDRPCVNGVKASAGPPAVLPPDLAQLGLRPSSSKCLCRRSAACSDGWDETGQRPRDQADGWCDQDNSG